MIPGSSHAPASFFELSLQDLLEELASPDPAPGAGFTAAVAVAMAAALVAMSARLSREHWPEARGAGAQAESLRKRVVPLAERNVRAYLEALSLLRGRESQEGAASGSRDDAIASALERAAEIPLQIGEAASDVAALAAAVAENGEPSLRADVAVAASLAVAGARATATLVEVNLGTTSDDPRVALARSYVEDAAKALEQAQAAVA